MKHLLGNIRLAVAADQPLLREMLYEAAYWRPGCSRPRIEQALYEPSLAKLLQGWGRSGDAGMVALSKERVSLGAAWYRFWTNEDHSWGYVDADTPEFGMGVIKEARRQGVGEALLRALVDHAGRQGIVQVSLSVERDNPAERLYEKLGFRRIGKVGGAWTMVCETDSVAPHSP